MTGKGKQEKGKYDEKEEREGMLEIQSCLVITRWLGVKD
jgi:hypothetical protein